MKAVADSMPERPAKRDSIAEISIEQSTGLPEKAIADKSASDAPIAQLDRALPSEGRGLRFES